MCITQDSPGNVLFLIALLCIETLYAKIRCSSDNAPDRISHIFKGDMSLLASTYVKESFETLSTSDGCSIGNLKFSSNFFVVYMARKSLLIFLPYRLRSNNVNQCCASHKASKAKLKKPCKCGILHQLSLGIQFWIPSCLKHNVVSLILFQNHQQLWAFLLHMKVFINVSLSDN